jgi:uncharacterized protein YjbI with pentapeptide repeats
MVGDEPIHNGNQSEQKPLLEKKEEFTLLLKGIEENSKHARSVMFALILACVYVLLSAFSSPVEKYNENKSTTSAQLESTTVQRTIELPVIKVKVKDSQFFFFSPLVILIAYLYLHIYIRELRKRLISIQRLIENHKFSIDNPNHFLFPWIVVFAFQARQTKTYGKIDSSKEETPAPSALSEKLLGGDPIIKSIANILLWILGPIVLLVLWGLFVGQRDPVSIVPCLSFCLAFCTARYTAENRLRTWSRIIITVLGLVFIVFTLSSVPELSKAFGLNKFWDLSNYLVDKVKRASIDWYGWILIIIVIIQLLPAIFGLGWRLLGKRSLRNRLQRRDFWLRSAAQSDLKWIYFLSHIIFSIRNRHIIGIPKRISDNTLQGCHISWINLRRVDFTNSDLRETKFIGVDFIHSLANGADLRGAHFLGVELTGTRMENANMDNIYTEVSDFSNAVLDGASIANANLSGSFFGGASMYNVDLTNSNLSKSILIDVNLLGANLTGVRLDGAQLKGNTNLTGANLTDISVRQTKYSKNVKFPEGFKIPAEMWLIDENE